MKSDISLTRGGMTHRLRTTKWRPSDGFILIRSPSTLSKVERNFKADDIQRDKSEALHEFFSCLSEPERVGLSLGSPERNQEEEACVQEVCLSEIRK